jgi:hypothetical protein
MTAAQKIKAVKRDFIATFAYRLISSLIMVALESFCNSFDC